MIETWGFCEDIKDIKDINEDDNNNDHYNKDINEDNNDNDHDNKDDNNNNNKDDNNDRGISALGYDRDLGFPPPRHYPPLCHHDEG